MIASVIPVFLQSLSRKHVVSRAGTPRPAPSRDREHRSPALRLGLYAARLLIWYRIGSRLGPLTRLASAQAGSPASSIGWTLARSSLNRAFNSILARFSPRH